MNYEQKYKEALNKIKPLYEQAKRDGNPIWSTYEYLIPELRESEDERIRKEMIEAISEIEPGKTYIRLSQEEKEAWIDYLEKQKELFESGRGLYYYDGEKTTYCGYTATEENPYDFAMNQQEEQKEKKLNIELIQRSWYMEGYTDGEFKREPMWNLVTGKGGPKYEKNEKYGHPKEQKPAEWDDYTKTNLDRAIQIIKNAKGNLQGYQMDDGIYECDKAIEALEHFLYRGLEIEQPTEWSEEDEKIKQSIIKDIEWERNYTAATTCEVKVIEKYNEQIAWLKSLHPQPKIEWSEEDEKMNKEIRLYLKQDRTDFPGRAERINKMIEWLINICPNSQWKPSEEQMNALLGAKGVLRNLQYNDWAKILEELYEQLKKLM